jgi:hypothetical protein
MPIANEAEVYHAWPPLIVALTMPNAAKIPSNFAKRRADID